MAKRGNLIPVFKEVLADEDTPVRALAKLLSRPYAFMLESVEGGEKWGRYTFLGADPRMVLRVKGEDIEIEEQGEIKALSHNGDPLAVIANVLGRYRPVIPPGLPRFFGGAVGYLGYDMARHFEKKLRAGRKSLENGSGDAAFLVTDTLVIFDNVRHTVKMVSCVFLEDDDADIEQAYRQGVEKIEALEAILSGEKNAAQDVTQTKIEDTAPNFKSSISKREFMDMGYG